MLQDATWYGGRPQPRRLCVKWRPSPPPQKGGVGGGAPKFSAHVYWDWGQTTGWMKLVLGMEVGLSPGDFVIDGDPVPLPKKGAQFFFGLSLLRPNGRMDQDATWHKGRPQPRRLCVKWGPSPPPHRRWNPSSIFGPILLWPNGWMHQDAICYGDRPQPRGRCVT